jgi:hypothetical protein
MRCWATSRSSAAWWRARCPRSSRRLCSSRGRPRRARALRYFANSQDALGAHTAGHMALHTGLRVRVACKFESQTTQPARRPRAWARRRPPVPPAGAPERAPARAARRSLTAVLLRWAARTRRASCPRARPLAADRRCRARPAAGRCPRPTASRCRRSWPCRRGGPPRRPAARPRRRAGAAPWRHAGKACRQAGTAR